ncbi:MAG: hypothetical protein PHN82_03510 [bacterium]|nr:hypothetical protein [bacterium]
MAIERMKRLTFLFPSSRGDQIEEWLYRRGAVQLRGIEGEFPSLAACASPICIDEAAAAGRKAKAAELLAEARALHGDRPGFLDSLFPVKTVVRAAEIEEALAAVDLDALHAAVAERTRERKGEAARLDNLRRERESLGRFSFLALPLGPARALSRLFLIVAEGSHAAAEHLAGDAEAAGLLAWETVRRDGEGRALLVAGRKADGERCLDILRAHGFRVAELPEIDGTVAERLAEIAREEGESRARIARLESELRALLPPGAVRRLACVHGHWESEERRAAGAQAMLCSARIGLASGYARARDLPRLLDAVGEEMPGTSVVAADPVPGEEVPVSIRLPRWLAPAQLLINMFGLPNYFALDPTPFLFAVFLAFFGICFADVFYGALLALLSWLLMRRYRRQPGLADFFRLFIYCGASTVLFGALTGSWAADMYREEYLGPGNPLLAVARRLAVIDMLEKPVVALMAALAIGIFAQFYGIVLKVYQGARQRNWRVAVYDGVFWLVYLGGLLATAFLLLAGVGGVARAAALACLAAGAAGLVCTQGRDQPTAAGRAIAGLVSLYGVMGTYGTTSFAGDVISYSRLLALGLTTYVVGMSFNIIAKLAASPLAALPAASTVLFLAVAIPGHLFNFIISALSGFVHSARLILLEFFGRFYEGGGKWFSPHGFASGGLEVRG